MLSLSLEVSKQAEAISTLHAIRELREIESSPAPPHLMVPMYYTLALLHTVTRDLDKVSLRNGLLILVLGEPVWVWDGWSHCAGSNHVTCEGHTCIISCRD